MATMLRSRLATGRQRAFEAGTYEWEHRVPLPIWVHPIIVRGKMIPAGYMAKRVEESPDWIGAPNVDDIYSVSSCVSEDFADFINYWQHNGYWLFDSPNIISRLAEQNSLHLEGTKLFYYEIHENQFNEKAGSWEPFGPEPSFALEVKKPTAARLEGYDVVSFSVGTSPECSPLSCNHLAKNIVTNRHCLLSSFEDAKGRLEEGEFVKCEPGPYRIFAVHSLEWP